MTTLKEFDHKLRHHDWYFAYSDDHSVYLRGHDAAVRLERDAKLSPAHKELYDAWERRFFTGKPWNTPEFTKEQLDAERARILGDAI